MPIDNGGNTAGVMMCELVGDNFLCQMIEGPTHVAGNTLDLLLCNQSETIINVSTHSPGMTGFPSDHYIIDFSLIIKFQRLKPV